MTLLIIFVSIANTPGATGVGAQAALVFGSEALGLFSAALTFAILVFSEIIPKTLGAYYWRQLAPGMSYVLRVLIVILFPFVVMANWLTRLLARGKTLRGLSREEFVVMAELGAHMMLVVDEYGGVDGVITLEDIFETLVGREIVDEVDRTVDMQKLARRLGQRRNRQMGIPPEQTPPDKIT